MTKAMLWFAAGEILGEVIGHAIGYMLDFIGRFLDDIWDGIVRAFKYTRPDSFPTGIRYTGKVWRYTDPQYAAKTYDIYPGNIAADYRYSGEGVGAMYASDSQLTAYKEVRAGRTFEDVDGYVFVSRDIDVDNLLDLTDPEVRRWLGVDESDLLRIADDPATNYAITQSISDFARTNSKHQYNGLIVPSARNQGGKNVVYFDDL